MIYRHFKALPAFISHFKKYFRPPRPIRPAPIPRLVLAQRCRKRPLQAGERSSGMGLLSLRSATAPGEKWAGLRRTMSMTRSISLGVSLTATSPATLGNCAGPMAGLRGPVLPSSALPSARSLGLRVNPYNLSELLVLKCCDIITRPGLCGWEEVAWGASLTQSYSIAQTAIRNTSWFAPKPIMRRHTVRSSATTAAVH